MTKIKYPKIKCGLCGNCCRFPIVPITHKDLARLIKSTGKPARDIVRFCSSAEMDYSAESGMWISFKSGKRAMVLRKKSERCIFQTPQRTCAIYPSRPQTCRSFPYSVSFENSKDTTVSEITLNKISKVLKCEAKKCLNIDINTLIANVRKENREDKEYHRLVKRWNESKSKGNTTDFLQFITKGVMS